MKCQRCQCLLPPGYDRCPVCGWTVGEGVGGSRRASTYRGVHSPTDAMGRPIRAWFDLGPNPWVNLIVGLSILLGFAASALPTVIVERNRVPASVSDPQVVVDDSQLFVRFLVRDEEGRSLSVGGEAFVTMWMEGPPQSAGTRPLEQSFALAPNCFRPASGVYSMPDGSTRRAREVVAQVGPLDIASMGSAQQGASGPTALAIGLRVRPDRGQPMEAGAKWFALTEELQSTLRGI